MDNTVTGDMTEENLAREFEEFKSRFDFSSVPELVVKDKLADTKDAFNKTVTILKGVKR